MILLPVFSASMLIISVGTAKNERYKKILPHGHTTIKESIPSSMLEIYKYLIEIVGTKKLQKYVIQNEEDRLIRSNHGKKYKLSNNYIDQWPYLNPTFDKYVTHCRNEARLSTSKSTECFKCKCTNNMAYQCTYNLKKHNMQCSTTERWKGSTFRNENGCLICRGLDEKNSICMQPRRCILQPPRERQERDKYILDEFLRNLGNYAPGQWIPTTHENAQALAGQALVAGYEPDGGALWVIRASSYGDLLPGKLAEKHRYASVPWARAEHEVNKFEVFCARPEEIRWVKDRNGNVPPNAIPGGHTSYGETLYIARANEQGSLTPGKVHPSHGVMYLSYKGNEKLHYSYEVLCSV